MKKKDSKKAKPTLQEVKKQIEEASKKKARNPTSGKAPVKMSASKASKAPAKKKEELKKKAKVSVKKSIPKTSPAKPKKKAPAKKATRMSAPKKVWKKGEDKEYRSLYRKINARKKKIQALNKERKKGYKTKRSAIYKEIVVLNGQLKELCRKRKYKLPNSTKLRQKRFEEVQKMKPKRDAKRQIREYTKGVWEFEDILATMIANQAFKTIVIVNVNKTFHLKNPSSQRGRKKPQGKSPKSMTPAKEPYSVAPSTILYWYDQARDSAYSDQFSGTPMVLVIEDDGNSILTVEVIS